jgi:DNA-binding MarR family transcriptional regulator
MINEFDYNRIDDVLHSRIRTASMAVLVSLDEADFSFLKEKVNATDGNLSIHLKKLEEAGYIKVKKSFINRKPVSTYKATEKGKRSFSAYIMHLEKLIKNNNK